MVMCVSLFFTRPRWWLVCTRPYRRDAETRRGRDDGVMTPGEEPPEDGGRDWSRRSVRVRTARIAGNRNQEECVEQLFLVLSITARLYQQLDFRLLVSRTGRIRFCCFKPSVCGTSLRSPGKLPQLALNML